MFENAPDKPRRQHIKAEKPEIQEVFVSRYEPRRKHGVDQCMRLSGLEPLSYLPDNANMRKTFLMIGERCNVAGSSIYKKAIVDGNYDKAASIATKQVGYANACY